MLLESNLDMITDELQKFIDEYNKLSQDKKNWETQLNQKLKEEQRNCQVEIEACQIKIDYFKKILMT